MIRKIGATLGVLALLGCSGTNKADSGELRFSWWGGDERHGPTLEAIKLYEEQNPGVKIKAEYGGWDGHQAKIATQLAGKTAPDVMQINHNWLDVFSANGKGFYDLKNLNNVINLQYYPKDVLDKVTINGYLNMVPYAMTGKVFSFNSAALAKYALPIPRTWDEYRSVGNALKAKNPNAYLIAATDAETAYQIMLYYLLQKTGKTTVNDSNNINFSREELIDGFNFLRSLTNANVLMNQQQVQSLGRIGTVEQLPGWIAQDVMGVYAWDSTLAKYKSTLPASSEMVLAPYPTLPNAVVEKAALGKISLGLGINANTQKASLAAGLVNFLINDDAAIKILGLSRGIPLNSHAVEVLANDGTLAGLVFEANNAAMANLGDMLATVTEHAKFKAFYLDMVTQFDYGQLNAETAADWFITQGNKVLAEIVS